jgi:transposase InsO family protein
MEMWHDKIIFLDRRERHISLVRFVNFYNTVKPHRSLDNITPYEKLLAYFGLTQNVNNG